MIKSATFSPGRKYRYTLWRSWKSLFPYYAMFIGLNPSTADETKDDNTIRRCVGYAMDWGYGGLCMMNLFAFRATKPKDMKKAQHPIGIDNNKILIKTARKAGIIIAAWGTQGAYLERGEEIKKMIPNLYYLRLTKNGFPAHPLYLPKILKPIQWNNRKP